VDSGNLTLSTTTSGDVNINSVATLDIDAATIEIDASVSITVGTDITTVQAIGRDTDNEIAWTTDDQLDITIGGVTTQIASISTGTGDNDKLVTQGYVDDAFTVVEKVFLPIVWGRDGTAPPDFEEDIEDGSGVVNVRNFDDTTVEDVVFTWQVPDDIVAGSGITFSVVGIITNATAPAATEGVSFKLSGYSVGVGDGLDGTFGTEVESKLEDLNNSGCTAQYDMFRTVESGTVTVTDLAAGETAFLHFERDTADADDDYGQDVGVVGVIIKYTKNAIGA